MASQTNLSASHSRLASVVSTISGWSARHRKTVLAGWFAFVAVCLLAGSLTGTRALTGSESGVGESGRADQVIENSGLRSPATESILLRSRSAHANAAAATALARRLRELPVVKTVAEPRATPQLRAERGRVLLVQLTMRGDPDSAGERVASVERAVSAIAAAHPAVTLSQAGDATVSNGIDQMVGEDLSRAELTSLPLTLFILLFAFGAVVAASVPLMLGITSAAAALGLLGPISQLVPVHDSTSALVVLIGLAVGVDYSLFCIRRERAERAAGRSNEDALAITMATVGRAVVVAGSVVMLALAGFLISGIAVFASMAVGTMAVVAIAVVGSVTVLPAALAMLGDRLDRGRVPFTGRAGEGRIGVAWGRVAARATARPKLALGGGAAILVLIALPALTLKTGDLQLAGLPDSIASFKAAKEIENTFPGSPGAAQIVVKNAGGDNARTRARLDLVADRALDATGGQGDVTLQFSKDGSVALLSVPMPEQRPDELAQTTAGLRDAVHPMAGEFGPDASVLVTGRQIGGVDFSQRLSAMTPVVIAIVLSLAFLLVMAAFRSAALAATVIVLNLLSVTAAYGVLAVTFQHDWAEGLLQFTNTGAIANWVPLFAFVILFGLSMDYTVLLLEKIREDRAAGLSPREAAASAVAATAGTVTSAAVVMVAVFGLFAAMRFPDNKQLGVGLATAILIDATLVRGVLLPAAVALLGDRWRVPKARVARTPLSTATEVAA